MAAQPAAAAELLGGASWGFPWRYFLAGALAACFSHSCAVPADVIKTRMQTRPGEYKGALDALATVVREEGPGMLLQGLGPTLAGFFVHGFFKFGLYESFKPLTAAALGPEVSAAEPLVSWLLAAFFAELFASAALCPFEATRVRLVAQPSFAKGLLDGMPKLALREGLPRLFYGLPALWAMKIPYTTCELAVYEQLTTALYHSLEGLGWISGAAGGLPQSTELAVSTAAAIVSGVASSLVSQPGDTLMARINQDEIEGPAVPAILGMVQELGWRGLFRGLVPRLLQVTFIITTQLIIYDVIKDAVGIPVTGR